MTITEICLILITLCMLTLTTGVVIVVAKLLPLARSLETLTGEGRALVLRLQGVTGEVEGMVRDARQVEARAAGLVRGVLDRVEPPLQQLASVIGNVSSAVTALARLLPIGGRSDAASRQVDP
jgi:uncharacterized protein YoxC